jgi:hypothetical protein
MKIDPKIIEAAADVLAPSIGSEREAALVAPKAINAALAAGLREQIRAEAIREAADYLRTHFVPALGGAPSPVTHIGAIPKDQQACAAAILALDRKRPEAT